MEEGKKLSRPGFVAALKAMYMADMVMNVGGKELENWKEAKDWIMTLAECYEVPGSDLTEYDALAKGYVYSDKFLEETNGCMNGFIQGVIRNYRESPEGKAIETLKDLGARDLNQKPTKKEFMELLKILFLGDAILDFIGKKQTKERTNAREWFMSMGTADYGLEGDKYFTSGKFAEDTNEILFKYVLKAAAKIKREMGDIF